METNEKIQQILNKIVKVDNMQSGSGRDVPNQFIIKGDDFTLFQSYTSPIVMRHEGKIYLFPNWDYSKTTGKYRNMFLMETKKETLDKLKKGIYIPVGFEVPQ